MADINKEASWVTARLMEVSNATQDGTNILITNANIQNFTPSDVVRTSAQELTDAEQTQVRTNIGAAAQSDITELSADITDLSNDKMDKLPEGSVAGNIPLIDNNENIADSGIGKDNLILSPQLSSHIYAEDQTPYLYRQTGGGAEAGTREWDSIVGGSIVHRQMLQYNRSSVTINGLTVTNNLDGTYTVNGTPTATATYQIDTGYKSTIVGHVYYFAGYNRTGDNGHLGFGGLPIDTGNGGIWKNPQYTQLIPRYDFTVGYAYNNVNMFAVLYDLTERFGSAVAEWMNSNKETAKQILNGMGLNKVATYTAEPSLLSTKPTGHKMTGFNQWNEQWDLGDIDSYTGEFKSGNYIRSAELIPVFPSTAYYLNIPSLAYFYEYDGSGKAVKTSTGVAYHAVTAARIYTTGASTRFLAFRLNTGGEYGNNLCINISDPLRNGTYEPYTEHTYPLTGIELRGVSAVDSDGNIYFDGDTYAPGGTVSRKYGIRAYQSGDESLSDAITDGTNTVYKLTSPTIETATPYDALQVCDPLGTEEYVDERTVPVPVGHVTKYPVDQVRKLDGLPSDFSTLIAPTEKEFKASATRTTGFKFIYQNQLYKCIANVASGAAYTIGTNVKKTTIAEELDLLS